MNSKRELKTKFKQNLIITLALGGLLLTNATPAFAATQQELQSQINQVNNQINQINNSLTANKNQQVSIDSIIKESNSRIDAIQLQIFATEKQIEITKGQINDTNNKIERAKVDLAKQKKLMAEYLKTMYEEDRTSTFELIATSNSFSDFVDRAEYLEKMQQSVKETQDKIVALKIGLDKQAEELVKKSEEEKQLKTSQQTQKEAVESQRNYQRTLLANAQAQAAILRDNKNDLFAKKSQLSAAYNETIIKTPTPAPPTNNSNRKQSSSIPRSTGSYPYGNPPAAHIIDTPDAYGYFIGECTSYVAWKRASIGRAVPRAMGNGGQWANTAMSLGMSVDRNPRVGDAMVFPYLGGYGHVAYVEAVYGNGTVLISEYNWTPYSYGQRIVNPFNYSALFIH